MRSERLLEALGAREGISFWRAPGRVNIIGEHVDYMGGTVLPFACDLEMLLAEVPHPHGSEIVLESLDGTAGKGLEPYVTGVTRALREAGFSPRGFRGALTSSIPVGAGLASSAALEAAIALAALSGERPAAEVLQRAEHLAVGVPCGVMDQATVLHARAGHVMALDCSEGTWTYIPLPEEAVFVVVDTGTRRELNDGRYARRRAEAEHGELARVRHVQTEKERVARAIEALHAHDLPALGRLIDASHASLRDDFDVSSPALEEAVAASSQHPDCLGARLVGAGFAGCTLALVRSGAEDDFVRRIEGALPGVRALPVRPVDGAGPIEP